MFQIVFFFLFATLCFWYVAFGYFIYLFAQNDIGVTYDIIRSANVPVLARKRG